MFNFYKYNLINKAGTLHEVRVTDCTNMPCRIVKNKEYKVEIDFTPSLYFSQYLNIIYSLYYFWVIIFYPCIWIFFFQQDRNTTTASVKCDTVLYGQIYRIPEEPICPSPLNNFTMYTYTVKFVVPYFIPPTKYPIRCGFLDDTKIEQLCLNGVGIIV